MKLQRTSIRISVKHPLVIEMTELRSSVEVTVYCDGQNNKEKTTTTNKNNKMVYTSWIRLYL